tara:strand:- start:170 stop:274 length:105 start_codon:yes stop_codon:yes gene_type:complete
VLPPIAGKAEFDGWWNKHWKNQTSQNFSGAIPDK